MRGPGRLLMAALSALLVAGVLAAPCEARDKDPGRNRKKEKVKEREKKSASNPSPAALAFKQDGKPAPVAAADGVKTAKDAPHPALLKGVELARAGDTSACLAQTGKLTAQDEQYLLEGICFQAANRDEQAVESLGKALRSRGTNSDAAYFMGIAHMKGKKYAKALSSFEEALWFGRLRLIGEAEISYQMSLAHLAMGKDDKAKAMLEKAAAAVPPFAQAKIELADIRMKDGQKAAAINLLREAAGANPGDVKFKLKLVQTLLNRVSRPPTAAEVAEAKTITEQLVAGLTGARRFQNEAFPLYVRALLESGEFSEANQSLSNALKAVPHDPELNRLKRQLAISREAKESQDRIEAEKAEPGESSVEGAESPPAEKG